MSEEKLVGLILKGKFSKAANILKDRDIYPLRINKSIDGVTILMHAVLNGNTELVKLILDYPRLSRYESNSRQS